MIQANMTEPSSLECMSSSGARPKEDIRLYVEARTTELIHQCLEDGTQLDMMRDLWYEMKGDHEITSSKNGVNEEKYSDKITNLIRNTFAEYAETDPSVYTRLGLHSRVLVKGEVPIVVIFEKKKQIAMPIINKFRAGHIFSTGQFPTFESVHVANYFNECGYSKGYVFVVSDYDPAGENMWSSIKARMNKFSDIDIETIWVNYGENPTEDFENYDLADNKINHEWISEGKTLGVEFNAPSNISKGILTYLTNSIVNHVDPRYYVLNSYERWVREEEGELALEDKKYQEWNSEASRLHKLMRERNREFEEAVSMIETDYIYETEIYPDKHMKHNNILALTEARDEVSRMKPEDIEYYHDLLDNDSPYLDDYLDQEDETRTYRLTDEELEELFTKYRLLDDNDDDNITGEEKDLT